MKIMQTLVNFTDFQSRIIEINMSWEDFKEYIYSHIYEGIHDNQIGVDKSYPIGKGLMIGSASWYEVIRDDEFHLYIVFERNNFVDCKTERVCFLVLED